MTTPTVRVQDPDTKQIVTIPASELAPGMVKVRVETTGEEYYVTAASLTATTDATNFRHPPFTEEVRDLLKTIRDTFADVRPLSLEGWEGGFRCDAHPEKEIDLWLNMAVAYRHFTRHLTPGPTELEKKWDIFQLILSFVNNGPDNAAATTATPTLSRKRVREIIDELKRGTFYGEQGAK